jgi:hypothetical protein
MRKYKLLFLARDWENRQGPMPFPITVEALPAAVAEEEVRCHTLEGVVATEDPVMIRTF